MGKTPGRAAAQDQPYASLLSGRFNIHALSLAGRLNVARRLSCAVLLLSLYACRDLKLFL